jgi:hypothetical protein
VLSAGGASAVRTIDATASAPSNTAAASLSQVARCSLQVRVAGPAVAVGERGGNEASDVDLSDPLRPGPSEQGMVLDERQGVRDGGLMGAFDHGRHCRISGRP